MDIDEWACEKCGGQCHEKHNGRYNVPQIPVRVWNASPDIDLPTANTEEAACLDIRINEDVHLEPQQRAKVGTGLYLDIPYGQQIRIYTRSGLCAKTGLIVLNAPAIIDSDYTGEVMLVLYNSGTAPVDLTRGERVAQADIVPVRHIQWIPVDSRNDLKKTVRGDKGFGIGSGGVK